MKKQIDFDIDAAVKALREGKDLSGQDGVLTPLTKQLTEAAMKAELDEHLGAVDTPNRKNGSASKTIKNAAGCNSRHPATTGLALLSRRSSKSTRRTSLTSWGTRSSP